MVLFLRDQYNRTLLDLDISKVPNNVFGSPGYTEIHSVVDIRPYSWFLLNLPEGQRETFINAFDELQELRGWLWEVYFANKENTSLEYGNVLEILRCKLHNVAEDFGLYYVED